MNKISSKTSKRSVFLLLFFIFIALFVIIALFKLQILKYDDYQRSVIEQLTVETNVNPERGIIYDTNGKILATNKTVWVLYLCPKKIENAEFIAKELSKITDISYDDILKKAQKTGYKYQVLDKDLDEKTAKKIREFIDENGLTNQIELIASAKRYYPYASLASHTLGFVNADGIGIYGLEKVYNNVLEGTNGKYITAQDAKSENMPFQYEEYIKDDSSYNLTTTIDLYIQYQLEAVLEEAAVEAGAQNRATGIVMNPQTGEIYAMATYPYFDLNNPYKLDDLSLKKLENLSAGTAEYRKEYLNFMFSMWNNKAITELYEPGSTFKIVTTSVALQEKVASLTSRFSCTGALKIDGYYRPISCHKRTGHGVLTFAEALQQSCNPSMMTLGFKIGREKFYSYFGKFGYMGKTGIDLPSESSGYYHSFNDFSNVSLAVYSFGQTFKTTAIQQLRAVSIVANGGYSITPHLIKNVSDKNGNIIYEYDAKKGEQIIDTDVCETISGILKDGVNGDGGAKNAYVAGYDVAAKTGTSEKKDKYDENGNTSYRVSSCVAYAPSEDAQVAVIIIVDEPSVGSKYGSVVAAPYVSKLLELILPYMGKEPSYSESDEEHFEITVGSYVNKGIDEVKNELKGIPYEIIGDGETILNQMPLAGGKIYKKTGKIILYTTSNDEEKTSVVVPNVIGKSAEEANRILSNAGLNIKINGATNFKIGEGAKVVAQFPSADTVVPYREIVTINILYTEDKD